jgi:hypothetical protein
MIQVAIGAREGLLPSDTASGFHEIRAADSEMLTFAIFDLQKRVEELRAALCS